MPKITRNPYSEIVSVRLSQKEAEIIDEISKYMHMKRSQLLRFLIREALTEVHGVRLGGDQDGSREI